MSLSLCVLQSIFGWENLCSLFKSAHVFTTAMHRAFVPPVKSAAQKPKRKIIIISPQAHSDTYFFILYNTDDLVDNSICWRRISVLARPCSFRIKLSYISCHSKRLITYRTLRIGFVLEGSIGIVVTTAPHRMQISIFSNRLVKLWVSECAMCVNPFIHDNICNGVVMLKSHDVNRVLIVLRATHTGTHTIHGEYHAARVCVFASSIFNMLMSCFASIEFGFNFQPTFFSFYVDL